MECGRNPQEDADETSQEGARSLFLRLLERLKRVDPPPSGEQAAPDSLLPPGRRSGRGTESLEPYLNQYRNSRPSSLE
ncbi:hypothetical protein GCM10028796_49860 [Ramlibacter monticola]|uniref:Uncharacterized protein n=1 Tax=Ramlibacter monticola TaxID=1926872 RepID=A0A936YYA9_9BURK|nr:hypothetical protein [Ramlibacter monticola]MBL0390846.1 hypothetical protein [Ramlibacter monticola]